MKEIEKIKLKEIEKIKIFWRIWRHWFARTFPAILFIYAIYTILVPSERIKSASILIEFVVFSIIPSVFFAWSISNIITGYRFKFMFYQTGITSFAKTNGFIYYLNLISQIIMILASVFICAFFFRGFR